MYTVVRSWLSIAQDAEKTLLYIDLHLMIATTKMDKSDGFQMLLLLLLLMF